MTQHTCVLCPVLRKGREARIPESPPACDGDRYALDRILAALPGLHQRLVEPEDEPVNDRWYAVRDSSGALTGDRRRADPAAALGGAAAVPGQGTDAPVTGSRERTTPARLNVVDLTAPARGGTVRDTMVPAVVLRPVMVKVTRTVLVNRVMRPVVNWERRVQRTPLVDESGEAVLVAAGDQVGHLSAATVLRLWVRDWRDALWPRSPLPDDTVAAMVPWLRHRLFEAIDGFEAIADFAGEVRALGGGMRAALGESTPRPQVVLGVPCARCNAVGQIVAHPDGFRECAGPAGCGRLYNRQEWADWLGGDEIRAMLPHGALPR